MTATRTADGLTVMRQIGPMTYMAINGGRPWTDLGDGVQFATGHGARRQIRVTLMANDTYTVTRVRIILRGARMGEEEIEYQQPGVYEDQLSDVVYQASIFS